jgi:hypothetical protein
MACGKISPTGKRMQGLNACALPERRSISSHVLVGT